MWYICTMEYYSDKKKKEILSFATTWMIPGGFHAKGIKSDRERKKTFFEVYRMKKQITCKEKASD